MIKARKQLRLSLKNLIAWEQNHPMTTLIFFLTLEEKKKLFAPTAEPYINTLVKMVRPPGVEPGRHYLPRDFKSLVSTCSTMAA